MTELPTGTVTFLFTDIEGSTKLWEAHRDTMQTALVRHDLLMREAIGAADGVVFKTVGDAFCAAFATAPDALSAVLDVQLSLAREPGPKTPALKDGMALHSGVAALRDGDYFGTPFNLLGPMLEPADARTSARLPRRWKPRPR